MFSFRVKVLKSLAVTFSFSLAKAVAASVPSFVRAPFYNMRNFSHPSISHPFSRAHGKGMLVTTSHPCKELKQGPLKVLTSWSGAGNCNCSGGS